jgi:hypothetical protein
MELGRTPFSGLFDKYIAIRSADLDKEEKKLDSGVEDSKVKLFSDRTSHWRSLKSPSDLGMKPEKELSSQI